MNFLTGEQRKSPDEQLIHSALGVAMCLEVWLRTQLSAAQSGHFVGKVMQDVLLMSARAVRLHVCEGKVIVHWHECTSQITLKEKNLLSWVCWMRFGESNWARHGKKKNCLEHRLSKLFGMVNSMMSYFHWKYLAKDNFRGKKIKQVAPCIEKQQQFFQWVVLKVEVTLDYVVCSYFGKRSSVKSHCCQE